MLPSQQGQLHQLCFLGSCFSNDSWHLTLYVLGSPRSYQQWVHTVKVSISLWLYRFFSSRKCREKFRESTLATLNTIQFEMCVFYHTLSIFFVCSLLIIIKEILKWKYLVQINKMIVYLKPTSAFLFVLPFQTPVCWLVSNSVTHLGGGNLSGARATFILAMCVWHFLD